MSDDNSGKIKRGKKQEDYKQSKKPDKGFVIFEPRSNYKGPRDDTSSNKPSNTKPQTGGYDHKDSRHDHSDRNKPGKSVKSDARRSGDTGWKRKHVKHSKGAILDVFERVSMRKDAAELASNHGEVFTERKLPPVNDSLVQLDANDALMPRGGYSAQTTTKEPTTEAPPAKLELFDLAKERFDPIQAMRNKMKKEPEPEDKPKAEDELLGGEDEEELGGKGTDLEAELGSSAKKDEGLGDDEEKFSDIDAMFEKKLKNNDFKEEQDVFDELFTGQAKKEEIIGLEDDERPVWEDVDTKQVIKDIQQKDVTLSSLPQDKRAIFGEKYSGPQSQSDTRSTDSRSDKCQGIDFSRLNLESEMPEGYHPSLQQYYATVDLFNQQKFENPNVNPNQNYLTSQQLNTLKAQQQQQELYAKMMKNYQQQQPQPGNFMTNQLPQFKREAPKTRPNPSYPSFIFRYFCQDYDEKIWYYIDLQQKIQGPFSGKMMDEWYANGHLPLELNVTMGKNNGFRSLKELAEIIINGTINGNPGMQENQKVSNQQMQIQQQMQAQMNEIMKQKMLAEQQNLVKKTSLSDLDNPNYSQYSSQGYNKLSQQGSYGNINQPDYSNMQGYYGGMKVNPNVMQQQQKQQIPTGYGQQKGPMQQQNYPYQQGGMQNMQAMQAMQNMQNMQQQKSGGNYPNVQQQNPNMMSNIGYGMQQTQGKSQQMGGPLPNVGGGNPSDISLQLKGMLGLLGASSSHTPSQNTSGNTPSSSSKSNQQSGNTNPPRIDTSDFPSLGEASK